MVEMPTIQYKPLMKRVTAVIAVSLGAIASGLTASVSARILLEVRFYDRTSAFTASQLMPSANIEALAANVNAFIGDTYIFAVKV
jgi:hypothetical protein